MVSVIRLNGQVQTHLFLISFTVVTNGRGSWKGTKTISIIIIFPLGALKCSTSYSTVSSCQMMMKMSVQKPKGAGFILNEMFRHRSWRGEM